MPDGDENAIVDFKYSTSDRLTWWFDHHQSAFLTADDEAHFRRDTSGKKFLDATRKSCTEFIMDVASNRFGFKDNEVAPLVEWAHVIDGALYESPAQCVDLAAPALQLMQVIESVPDDVFIALRHATGVHSHLWAGSMAAQAGARMRVLGTRAAYVKQDADVQEAALRAGTRADAPGFGEDPEERWGWVGVGANARPIRTEKGDYTRFYALAVEWLAGRAPPPVDPADAIAVLDLIEAAQRSAAEATVVRFPQGC